MKFALMFSMILGCNWLIASDLAELRTLSEEALAPLDHPVSAAEVSASITPTEFLDCIGVNAKARWRSLYRPVATNSPPTERLRTAFTLGSLLADSYLARQAGDSQQFRNLNQDIHRYTNALGLGDKIGPMLLSESKSAEDQDWDSLIAMMNEKKQYIDKLLRNQRDEDPALFVGFGLWFRLFEIATDVMIADEEAKNRMLCIGSPSLLNSLSDEYKDLSERIRDDAAVISVGKVLTQLQRHWPQDLSNQPSDDLVKYTAERVKSINDRLTLK